MKSLVLCRHQSLFDTCCRKVNVFHSETSVKIVAGPGSSMAKVYTHGTVPWAFKLMEGPIKTFITQALAPNHELN
jgi:hypothetical protein